MKITDSTRDKTWAVVVLLCIVYFGVLEYSECPWVDGPLAFFHGCKNGGIDWNSFMQPIGMVIVPATSFSLVYWLVRIMQTGMRLLWKLCVWVARRC